MLGLAQLYQIRGRVGRSDETAYAYLFYPAASELTPRPRPSLDPGRPYRARGRIRDRDARPRDPRRGELLGAEQSGHVAAVGFELYVELLNERSPSCPVRSGSRRGRCGRRARRRVRPGAYIGSEALKIDLHRRLALVEDEDELRELRASVEDRYGELPEPVENLFAIQEAKLKIARVGAEYLVFRGGRITVGPLVLGSESCGAARRAATAVYTTASTRLRCAGRLPRGARLVDAIVEARRPREAARAARRRWSSCAAAAHERLGPASCDRRRRRRPVSAAASTPSSRRSRGATRAGAAVSPHRGRRLPTLQDNAVRLLVDRARSSSPRELGIRSAAPRSTRASPVQADDVRRERARYRAASRDGMTDASVRARSAINCSSLPRNRPAALESSPTCVREGFAPAERLRPLLPWQPLHAPPFSRPPRALPHLLAAAAAAAAGTAARCVAPDDAPVVGGVTSRRDARPRQRRRVQLQAPEAHLPEAGLDEYQRSRADPPEPRPARQLAQKAPSLDVKSPTSRSSTAEEPEEAVLRREREEVQAELKRQCVTDAEVRDDSREPALNAIFKK
jgi:hypothetical protein